jgi:hypothetical protein
MIVCDRENVYHVVARQVDQVVGEAGNREATHLKIARQLRHRRGAVRPRASVLDRPVNRSEELQTEPSAAFVVPDGGCFELGSGVSVKGRLPRHRLRS